VAHSILIIDSEEAFAASLSEALRAKGFNTTTAAGKDAVPMVESKRPDAIVLCAELAGMNGLSLCARLKRSDDLKSIPLVLTSADPKTQQGFLDHQTKNVRAEGYLGKPFSAADLLSVLRRFMDVDAANVDTVSDLELPGEVKTARENMGKTQKIAAPAVPTNGRSTSDLKTSDLPLPRDDSGGELQWMAKLRQSIARRDTEISELKQRLDDAGKHNFSFLEKEKALKDEISRMARERDESVKAHMSMQEKLTSTRLDLDDARRKASEEKRVADERRAALDKNLAELGEVHKQTASSLEAAKQRITALTKQVDEGKKAFEALKSSAGSLESQNKRQADRIGALEAELRAARTDADAKATEIARLERGLVEAKSDHAKESARLQDQLSKEVAARAKELNDVAEQLDVAKAQSEAKSKTIAMRDDELAKQKSNYEKRLAAADDAIKKAAAAAEAKGKQHAKDLEARDASIGGLKQKLSASSEEHSRAKEENERMLAVAAEVHAKETNRLREDHQAAMARAGEEHARAVELERKERSKLASEKEAVDVQAAELGKRVATLEKQLGQAKQQLTEGTENVARLERELAESRSKAEEVGRILNEGKKTKAELGDALLEIARLVQTAREVVISMPPSED
jgi:CheY-like chemotaxis protein